MNAREIAWRVFATELNSSTLEKKGDGESTASYVVTPLGTMVNRVLIAGVLTEKENAGSETEPMWRAKIQDVNGSFYLNVGRFQPEAAAAMVDLETPSFVAVIGKIRTYSPEEGKVFVSVRPERIITIDEATRMQWLLETSQDMWQRLLRMKKAINASEAGPKELVGMGFTETEAEGVVMALDHYGEPESKRYLKTIQSALRMLLPDKDVDFGLPGEMANIPEELDDDVQTPNRPSSGSQADNIEKEDMILQFIEELDQGGKGAPKVELDRMAEMEGISSIEVEELTDSLMNKGLIYEPNLGFLRKI